MDSNTFHNDMQSYYFNYNNNNNQNNFYMPTKNLNSNKQIVNNKQFDLNEIYNQNQSQDDQIKFIQSLKYVIEKYPRLVDLNEVNVGITQIIKNQSAPRFFVIKSFTEEDIHKVSK